MGHRVRLATHAEYRPLIMEYRIEYYPLGGDPRKLSEYMVKNRWTINSRLIELTRNAWITKKDENEEKDVNL